MDISLMNKIYKLQVLIMMRLEQTPDVCWQPKYEKKIIDEYTR
jgi:hypothetical protein